MKSLMRFDSSKEWKKLIKRKDLLWLKSPVFIILWILLCGFGCLVFGTCACRCEFFDFLTFGKLCSLQVKLIPPNIHQHYHPPKMPSGGLATTKGTKSQLSPGISIQMVTLQQYHSSAHLHCFKQISPKLLLK